MLRRQTSCNEPSPKDLGMACLPLLAVRHDVNKCQQMMRCIYIAFDGLSNARAAGISWSIWIYLGYFISDLCSFLERDGRGWQVAILDSLILGRTRLAGASIARICK